MQQKPVIFFDEASWKLWNVKDLKKTWMPDDDKIPIVKNSKGLKSVTFYGAVSNIFNTVQLMTFQTTNIEGTKFFLEKLIDQIEAKNLGCKPYLVMDNHPAHRANALKDHLQHFHPMWLPGYSSFLNSQETVWSALKPYLNRHFARSDHDFSDQGELEDEVQMIAEEWALTANTPAFFCAARSDWLRVIDDE